MLPTLCLLAALLVLVASAPASEPFSLRMLYSIIARQQGIISSGASTSTLESGVLAQALNDAVEQYPNQSFPLTPYLDQVLAVITPNLTNATADVRFSLDRFSIATALLEKQQSSELTSTENGALKALTASIALQPRNPTGGLWYYVYPQWSYLDGIHSIHSILPFMALQPYPNFTDIILQINMLREHCIHPFGLLVHGYDYSKTAVWADPVTGGSPYVWGRSLGWFMGGLVEGWQILCVDMDKNDDHTRQQVCEAIQQTFTSLIPPLLSFADADTGAWYQLTTLPDQQGNFLESSSTVLFIWSILKALRLGMLSPSACDGDNGKTTPPQSDAATAAALKAYHYTTSTFVTYASDPNNQTVGFNGTVAVNSLNSTANYTYYTSRPMVMDSLLGESAFVLASLEVEMLQTGMWKSGGT